jgi:hypothetical protein
MSSRHRGRRNNERNNTVILNLLAEARRILVEARSIGLDIADTSLLPLEHDIERARRAARSRALNREVSMERAESGVAGSPSGQYGGSGTLESDPQGASEAMTNEDAADIGEQEISTEDELLAGLMFFDPTGFILETSEIVSVEEVARVVEAIRSTSEPVPGSVESILRQSEAARNDGDNDHRPVHDSAAGNRDTGVSDTSEGSAWETVSEVSGSSPAPRSEKGSASSVGATAGSAAESTVEEILRLLT